MIWTWCVCVDRVGENVYERLPLYPVNSWWLSEMTLVSLLMLELSGCCMPLAAIYRLTGLVVRGSTSGAEDLGFE